MMLTPCYDDRSEDGSRVGVTMARSKSLVEVDVRGGPMTVARWSGSGAGAPLLMVHGISASHLAWAWVVNDPTLAGHDIIAPDLRGRGASNGLPGPYGLLPHVEDLCSVLDAFGLTQVCFIGRSMGAYIGVHCATREVRRLTSMVLVTATRGLLNQPEPLMPVAVVRARCTANPACPGTSWPTPIITPSPWAPVLHPWRRISRPSVRSIFPPIEAQRRCISRPKSALL